MKSKTKPLIFSLFFVLILITSVLNVNALMYGDYLDGSNVLEDSWIFSYEPDTVKGSLNYIHTGRNLGYRKALIQFNVTGVTESSSFIYLKVLGEFSQTYTYQHNTDFYIYRITESWDEDTVTWNTQPSISGAVSWTNVTVWGDLTGNWVYLNITDDWNSLVGESFADFYGYMIYFNAEATAYSYFNFFSKEYNVDYAPIIYYSQFSLDSTGNPIFDGDGDGDGIVTGEFLTNWFIYAIFLIVIPLGMTIYISNIGENGNPILMLITFMVSETLMSAISLSIGLIDIWFMLVIIIVDVMIIFGLMKGRG